MKNSIENVLFREVHHVALIRSAKGSLRSNHWHRHGWHYLYVVSGSMKYYERNVGSPRNPTSRIVSAGEMVFTPPNKVHKTVFLEDTVLLSLTPNRSQAEHEADLVHEKF